MVLAVASENGCVFCGIISGSQRSWTVYEGENALAFLDRSPATTGHTLVVPRGHAEDLWTISARDAAHVMTAVHAVAGLLRERLRPDGMTLFQATRPAGWQDVFHFHVHVVPRYDGDQLVRSWTAIPAGEEQLDATLARLNSG